MAARVSRAAFCAASRAPLARIFAPIIWPPQMTSRDLVPMAEECPRSSEMGKPLRLVDFGGHRGYTLIGESERILPHAVQRRFEMSSSGALIAATEGSTRPTSVVLTNAGIAVVEQYDLRMS